MVIVRTSRLSHPTVSCRHADRPGAGPTLNCWVSRLRPRPPCRSPHCCPSRPRAPATSEEAPRTWARSGPASTGAPPPPGRRSARGNARRRSAARRHSGVGCSEAPRPGSRRRGSGTRAPERTTTRSRSLTGARSRHPTQVRTGFDVSATLHSSAWPGPDVPRGGVEGGDRPAGAAFGRRDRRRAHPALPLTREGRHPSAAVDAPPPVRGLRPRRRPARRCGCRSGSR